MGFEQSTRDPKKPTYDSFALSADDHALVLKCKQAGGAEGGVFRKEKGRRRRRRPRRIQRKMSKFLNGPAAAVPPARMLWVRGFRPGSRPAKRQPQSSVQALGIHTTQTNQTEPAGSES